MVRLHPGANLTYRYFRLILKKAGIPQIRLYDLRHSCATLLLIAEENPKVVSERLGHADIALTLNVYSHAIPALQETAAVLVASLILDHDAPLPSEGTGTRPLVHDT